MNVLAVVRRFSVLQCLTLLVVAIGVFTLSYAHISDAACNPEISSLGRGCHRGYFTNISDTAGTNVLPIISGGQAVPSSSVQNATQLYNLIRSAYDSGNAQRRTGAAFIYNTMYGFDAPGIGKNISDQQWNELRAALITLDNAGRIEWNVNVSSSINSYWQGTQPGGTLDDDALYRQFKNETGIRIRNLDGSVAYEILRRCANPVGDPRGIEVPKNYSLVPQVDTVPDEVEPGSKATVTTSITNPGDVASASSQWEITMITVQPGKKAPHEDEGMTLSAESPCQSNGGGSTGNYFRSSDADCKNIRKGVGVFNQGGPHTIIADNIDIGDVAVGTKICFTLSVQPYSNTDARWAHAKPKCVAVGKKPKLQVWGGDVYTRGKIETSLTAKSLAGGQRVFGSWIEYGAFSLGTNKNFASGSGLADQTQSAQASWSTLTFANQDNTGAAAFGQYTNGSVAGGKELPRVADYFRSLTNRETLPGGSGSLASRTFETGSAIKVWTAPGDYIITDGAIPRGRSVVIVADGTVTIAGNITYTDDTLSRLKDLPQVVIVARNIVINHNVDRVDAWLIASEVINTCGDVVGNLTSGKCNTLLTVNGPVVTSRLLLNRTAGSDTGAASGDPAERFNLRPDAFLWAQLQSRVGNKASVVYQLPLPPRF